MNDKETAFKQSVFAYTDYDPKLLENFFDYWSEPDKKGRMRWELEKTWDLSKRLKRWYNNQKQWYGDSKVRDRVNDLHDYANRHN